MIIVRLKGGLGNQMFQYALGRYLSITNNTELKFDITHFKKGKNHDRYVLCHLNVCEKIASKKEIERLIGKHRLILKYLRKAHVKVNNKYIMEKFFYFDPKVKNLSGDIYLDGYWQTEKYFKQIENLIKYEFTFKKELEGENLKIKHKIKSCNSVSIHIRRKDYVTKRRFKKLYGGICTLDYYYQAIQLMEKLVMDPKFFVFSDDIAWALKNFKISNSLDFVTINSGKNSHRDMQLMQLCKHNIIANSSFSWWAGWLNPHKEKIVIAPSKWFNDKRKDIKDLLPLDWIKVGI